MTNDPITPPTTPETPPGYKRVHVRAFTNKKGRHVPAVDRLMRISGTDPIHDRRVIRRKKPGPVAGKPRFTTPDHAQHVWEQLAVPLAYFIALHTASDYPFHPQRADMLKSCINAVTDARDFINRFTTSTPELNNE